MDEKSEKLDKETIRKITEWLEIEGQRVIAEEPFGVLVSSEIIKLCSKDPPLIEGLPTDWEELASRIKPAAVHLSLGRICKVGGKTVALDEKRRFFKIEPYKVAIVETKEKLNMPNNLIGRWNLRISAVYKGLLWVGGPQVDPGYKGHLYCPLYNLSTEAVTLEYGEPFATIDFVRTTSGMSPKLKQVRFKAGDYPRFESAPEETLRTLKATQRRMEIFETTTLTVMGIIIAALAIITTSKPEISNMMWPVALWVLVLAIVTFFSGLIIGRLGGKRV